MAHPSAPQPPETALAKREERVYVVPALALAVDLDQPVEAARALSDVDQALESLQEARRVLQASVTAEAQRLGTRRIEFPSGVLAELGPDTDLHWEDVDGMQRELEAAGLPEERIGALFRQTVETKVVAAVANALERNNEKYAAIIRAHRRRVPKRQSVKVHVPRTDTPFDRPMEELPEEAATS